MNYSQRDERWSGIRLGTSGGHTIGSAGCLLTVMAAISNEYDPGTLNRYACRNGYYRQGNLLYFSLPEQLGFCAEVINCKDVAAPMDKVADTLRDNGKVLALVDHTPGGTVQQHWIRILSVRTDGDCAIHDPWLTTGQEYSLMARYGLWSWNDASRAIFRLALYTPSESIPAGRAGVVQTAVYTR